PDEAHEHRARQRAIDSSVERVNELVREEQEAAADLGELDRYTPPHQVHEQRQAEAQAQAQAAAQPDPQPTQADHEAQLRAALENPILRAHIEQQVAQTQALQQQQIEAIKQTANVQVQSILHDYPELQGITPAELPVAFKLMEAKDADRGKVA